MQVHGQKNTESLYNNKTAPEERFCIEYNGRIAQITIINLRKHHLQYHLL